MRSSIPTKLASAKTVDEALTIIAKETWARAGKKGRKQAPTPSESQLAAWLLDCPAEALERSHAMLAKAAGEPMSLLLELEKLAESDDDFEREAGIGMRDLTPDEMAKLRPAFHGLINPSPLHITADDAAKSFNELKAAVKRELADMPTVKVPITLSMIPSELAADDLGTDDIEWVWLPELAKSDNMDMRAWSHVQKLVPVAVRDGRMAKPATDWHQWRGAYLALVPLVKAWQWSDANVRETRTDKRVMPRGSGAVVTEERSRLTSEFFNRAGDSSRPAGPGELPLWPDLPKRKQVFLLDMLDSTDVPIKSEGTGAPLAMRIIVMALMALRPEFRTNQVPLTLPLRKLVPMLWPAGKWQRNKQMKRLVTALKRVDDIYYLLDSGNGRLDRVYPVKVHTLPNDPHLDDVVRLIVSYPPGSGVGPTVDFPELVNLGAKSTGRYRGYIGARSILWDTGVTRVRVGGDRWVWADNPDAYQILTLDDRRRIAYGRSSKGRTKAEIDGCFDDLPDLVVVEKHAFNPRTGEVGWRVLPAEATGAIAKAKRSIAKR